MTLRRALLRAMLWSLAFAAVTGVFAVLFAGGDLVWRVMGTGLVTAVACGVMLPVSSLIDRDETHAGGLLGMGVVVVEYLLSLALIWEVASALSAKGHERVTGVMVLLVPSCLVSIFLLRLRHKPFARIAARVGLVATAIAFVVFTIAILDLPLRLASQRWWVSACVIVVVGALTTINLVEPVSGSGRQWRWFGVVAGDVAGVLWICDIWIESGSDPGFVIFVLLLSTAVVVAWANLVAGCALTPAQLWVRTVTIAAAIVTAILVDAYAIYREAYRLPINDDLTIRGAAAAGIVAGCGSLALCVLARLNRRPEFEHETADFTAMTVVCPLCRKKQSLPIGNARCVSCGLRISLRVEEPRCPQCDYLLIGLTSARCPECGAAVT